MWRDESSQMNCSIASKDGPTKNDAVFCMKNEMQKERWIGCVRYNNCLWWHRDILNAFGLVVRYYMTGWKGREGRTFQQHSPIRIYSTVLYCTCVGSSTLDAFTQRNSSGIPSFISNTNIALPKSKFLSNIPTFYGGATSGGARSVQ